MESIAELNEDESRMSYKDKDGNELYKTVEEHGRSTLLPESNRTDEGGSKGFDIEQAMPIIRDPNYPERKVIYPNKPETNAEEEVEYTEEVEGESYTLDNVTFEDIPELSTVEVVSDRKTPQDTGNKRLTPIRKSQIEDKPDQPSSRIIFDLGDQIGEFECFYHRIFKDRVCLVLVWDNRYHGSRYNPSSKLKDAVDVYVGKERDHYKVLMGPRFTDDFRNEEYLILFISGDEDGKDR